MKKEGTYQLSGSDKFDRYLERKKYQSGEDQCFEAGILISEVEKIEVDRAYSVLRTRINKVSGFDVIWQNFRKIAAFLILPLLVYFVWDQVRNEQTGGNSQLSDQEIANPSGIRSKVVLPDGSTIWLNAESRIRYSIPFVRETREVELVGEAFLDVVKNPRSPLLVKFDQFTVRVLGTRFNVKAFPDDQQTEVVLDKGRIELEDSSKGSEKGRIVLKPDQQWVYNKTARTAVLKEVDAEKYIAWYRNRLVFNKAPMEEVVKQLERWYGVNVEIRDQELYAYKFTTVFENEPLHRVIELLEMSSPIRIRYIQGKVNAETGENEKPVVQISAE